MVASDIPMSLAGAYIGPVPDDWIRQWGDPVLHERAAPVLSFDGRLRAQVERMKQRLDEAEGAGLAGTQVGILQRMFVFRVSLEDEIDVLVNPRVVDASQETAQFLEGCLSYQAVAVVVERPAAVRVEAQTLDGRPRTLEAEGYRASLLQHEIDHLDGILTLDRAEAQERRRAISALLDDARALAA
jgi:peptide deformylase